MTSITSSIPDPLKALREYHIPVADDIGVYVVSSCRAKLPHNRSRHSDLVLHVDKDRISLAILAVIPD